MKRIILGLGLALGLAVVAVLGLALALARPDLMPDWAKLPARQVAAEGAGLYCHEHGVPEKFCTLCHPELASELLLCPEDGNIPEDICTRCHPEVEKKHNIQMCPEGHGLPEHFCIDCGKVTSAAALLPDDGWCAPHNLPEVLCSDCLADPTAHHPSATAQVCRQPLPQVRLATASLGRQIGLETAQVVSETHAHTLEANAETAFNANRYADVSPRVAGFLHEVEADLGQQVRAGDVLAVVDSPEVSAAKSRHISAQAALKLAQVTHERIRSLAQRDAVPAKQELEALTTLNQAESAALEAAQTLRNLGFTDSDLERINTTKETTSLLPIVAPIDGTVVQRHAVRGEAVQSTTQLFAVADTSSMWLWIDVYEADTERVAAGQPVSYTISRTDGPVFEGTVTWVGAEVDETTRTTQVRAELANPGGRLRANQFGQARIRVGEPHEVVVVPGAAVQTKDGTEVVFLPQDEGGVYRPQRILTKPSNRAGVVEVAWGLAPGDHVVTRGSFWLKTELMRGNIGAGCCE